MRQKKLYEKKFRYNPIYTKYTSSYKKHEFKITYFPYFLRFIVEEMNLI